MSRIDILWVLLLIAAMLATGCRGEKKQDGILVEIDWEASHLPKGAELLTYGAKSVRSDTLVHNKKGQIKLSDRLERDTIDFFILKDLEGNMLVPIFPHLMEDISVRCVKDSLYLSGIKYQDEIREYQALLRDSIDDVSEEMLSFLRKNSREPVTILFIQDVNHRFPKNSCAEELRQLLQTAIRVSTEYADVLGLHQGSLAPVVRHEFPDYVSVSGEEEQVDLKKKMRKNLLMAVNLLDISRADSAELSRIKAYYSVLDSLEMPNFNVFPMVDTLLKGWAVKDRKTWRLFLVDSTGLASSFMEAYDFSHPPRFMLVDSTMQIWRSWDNTDSLINFVKSYNDAQKRSRKEAEKKK